MIGPRGHREHRGIRMNNKFLIPCHRAIRSDLTLGGYQGGLKMKRALLEMEGVLFNSAGRVVTEEIFY
jgi:methylated-DNA-[protein]-cysteine S-methyltransferase